MVILKYIAIIVASYLLGSLNMGVLISKALPGGDVRRKGSGNAGATNMARVYGWTAGIGTLVGDMLKAAVAMIIGFRLLGEYGLAVSGICVMLGHCFPIFHGFKGGKGISVGGAISIGMGWPFAACVFGSFIIGAVATKKVSFGSLCGAVAIAVSPFIFSAPLPYRVMGVCCGILAAWRHLPNIKRLINGTEPDFKAKDSK